MDNVLIIGSGPAGLTAAIYLARADLEPVVVEGMEAGGTPPGGQLTLTTAVENFPGFPEGVDGPELMDRMRQQAERFGARFVSGDVAAVRFGSRPFEVELGGGETLRSGALVIASGATARPLGLPGERALTGRGVSSCATCDGAFFRDQDVVVVGGGDTAMEEALYLARICRSVTVVHRRDRLRASAYLARKATGHDRIRFLWSTVVVALAGVEQGELTGVRLRNAETGVESVESCGGLFVAIGHSPNTGFCAGQLELLPGGYVRTEGATSRTSVAGVFAAGDVMDPHYRQAVTAAGCGCRAAIDAARYLESLEE